MAKAGTRISRDTVDKVIAALKDAATRPPPRPESFTMQGVVTEVAPFVRELQQRGYALDDIVPIISKAGASFTTGAMKTYLSRVTPPSAVSKGASSGTGKLARKVTGAGRAKVTAASSTTAGHGVTGAVGSTGQSGSRLHEADPDDAI